MVTCGEHWKYSTISASSRFQDLAADVMVKAAQLYALMALDICTRTRAPD
jgi:hypothetical protein